MTPVNHILVVEDDQVSRELLLQTLHRDGHQVTAVGDGAQAMELLKKSGYQLVITDLRMPGAGGKEVLGYVRDNMRGTPVIITTGYGTVDEAVEAIRAGAYDFQEKPLNLEHLRLTVNRALREAVLFHAFDYLRHEQPYIYKFNNLIAESESMKVLMNQAARVAGSDVTVLLTGETGTGKSLIAGAIHANSRRREHTLVTVNCAALPETLLESELFGHEKGAFTGADKHRVGRIQQAHGGTLFLDEVGDMSLAIQAKMLRAIEDKVVLPLGSARSVKVDVRIIAATNVDLAKAVKESRFREDLFYRLSVTPLHLPPLRERPEDILPLAERFLKRLSGDSKKPMKNLTTNARRLLINYRWPGNVRELRSAIERALLFAEGKEITAGDLSLSQSGDSLKGETPVLDTLDLKELERRAIITSLEQSGWVQSRAAKLLGITPRTLHYKLDKHAINKKGARKHA